MRLAVAVDEESIFARAKGHRRRRRQLGRRGIAARGSCAARRAGCDDASRAVGRVNRRADRLRLYIDGDAATATATAAERRTRGCV